MDLCFCSSGLGTFHQIKEDHKILTHIPEFLLRLHEQTTNLGDVHTNKAWFIRGNNITFSQEEFSSSAEGEVEKTSWQDVGSNHQPAPAAYLQIWLCISIIISLTWVTCRNVSIPSATKQHVRSLEIGSWQFFFFFFVDGFEAAGNNGWELRSAQNILSFNFVWKLVWEDRKRWCHALTPLKAEKTVTPFFVHTGTLHETPNPIQSTLSDFD